MRSKLTYWLETVQLTDAMKKELNAFQLRGIRQILNKTHTYWNRDHTNKHLIEEATKAAYPNKPWKRIKLFSEFYLERKIKLMGHIIRAKDSDPLRAVTFLPNSLTVIPLDSKKRAGRPKIDWIEQTKQDIWTAHLNSYGYASQEEQDNIIWFAAKHRLF